MSKKRGSGDGSIYQLPDGRWRAAISLGFDLNNKRRRKVFTAKTRNAVRAKLNRALGSEERPTVAPERLTVSLFLDTWLAAVKESVRPKTYRTYSDFVALHLKPALGKRLLCALTADHVQAFLNDKVGSALCPHCKKSFTAEAIGAHVDQHHQDEKGKPIRPIGARTVRHLHAALRAALALAVERKLRTMNPAASGVRLPKVEQKEMQAFTPAQARAYLDAARGDRLEALFTVGVALGLREGEILGLGWEHIDLELGTLRVRRQVQRIDGKLQFPEVKTPKGRRSLALPLIAISALWAHKNRQQEERAAMGKQWQESGLVFTTIKGTAIDPRNIMRRHHAVLKRAGLPPMPFHSLRHSAASILLAQGVSNKFISEMLGHSRTAFTEQVYQHVIEQVRREAADKMNAALSDPTPVATQVASKARSERVH